MIEQAGLDSFDKFVKRADGLSAQAVLAIVVVALAYFIWKSRKDEFLLGDKRLTTWQDSTKAEIAQTEMMQKQNETLVMVVATVNMLSQQVKYLATVIEERIPRSRV